MIATGLHSAVAALIEIFDEPGTTSYPAFVKSKVQNAEFVGLGYLSVAVSRLHPIFLSAIYAVIWSDYQLHEESSMFLPNRFNIQEFTDPWS